MFTFSWRQAPALFRDDKNDCCCTIRNVHDDLVDICETKYNIIEFTTSIKNKTKFICSSNAHCEIHEYNYIRQSGYNNGGNGCILFLPWWLRLHSLMRMKLCHTQGVSRFDKFMIFVPNSTKLMSLLIKNSIKLNNGKFSRSQRDSNPGPMSTSNCVMTFVPLHHDGSFCLFSIELIC